MVNEVVMGPLSVALDADPAPETKLAFAEGVTLDARLLVITADGKGAPFTAITSALDYLGTPYDVFNAAAGPDLTIDVLADGDHGRYHGIVLDTGDLAIGIEQRAVGHRMDDAGVVRGPLRRAARGHVRSPGGIVRPVAHARLRRQDEPLAARCTAEGQHVFVGANCDASVAIDEGWAYGSQPTDAATLPLLVDGAGDVYAATRRYADGREALVLTFAQSPTAFHTLALVHGVVTWVTRGLFIGEHHVYASPQIDDLFLAERPLYGRNYRMTDADLQAFADWQALRRSAPVTAAISCGFRLQRVSARSRAGQDDLADKALALASSFTWLNHTWAHHVLTVDVLRRGDRGHREEQRVRPGVGLAPFSIEDLVTPEISGLDNAEAMRAVFDAGVRQLVSDTSVSGQDNPSTNAGYWLPTAPGISGHPAPPERSRLQRVAAGGVDGEVRRRAAAGSSATTRSSRRCSDALAAPSAARRERSVDVPPGERPRHRRGESLLSDLLDATLDKYAARSTFPVLSPTMDELPGEVEERMALDASGVSATIEPGPDSPCA